MNDEKYWRYSKERQYAAIWPAKRKQNAESESLQSPMGSVYDSGEFRNE